MEQDVASAYAMDPGWVADRNRGARRLARADCLCNPSEIDRFDRVAVGNHRA